MKEWFREMIFKTNFGVDKEHDIYNWFFSYKDLKLDLSWSTSECNKRVSWLIDNGYAVRYDNWLYKYMLTDKAMDLVDELNKGGRKK